MPENRNDVVYHCPHCERDLKSDLFEAGRKYSQLSKNGKKAAMTILDLFIQYEELPEEERV